MPFTRHSPGGHCLALPSSAPSTPDQLGGRAPPLRVADRCQRLLEARAAGRMLCVGSMVRQLGTTAPAARGPVSSQQDLPTAGQASFFGFCLFAADSPSPSPEACAAPPTAAPARPLPLSAERSKGSRFGWQAGRVGKVHSSAAVASSANDNFGVQRLLQAYPSNQPMPCCPLQSQPSQGHSQVITWSS